MTATATVGASPVGVAITPDGKNANVLNSNMFVPGTVSVIDTSTNTATATLLVGQGTFGMGIMPPPPSVPFLAFGATLAIDVGGPPPEDTFNVHSSFTLSSTASNGINPVAEPVTLQVGTYTAIIPAGSFTKHKTFSFEGVIGGVSLDALIKPTGTLRYEFNAKGQGASLTGTMNPVAVALTIGDDSGATSVTAHIARQNVCFQA